MALTSVRVKFGGVWYDMALNPGTGRYEAAVTAPGSPQEDFPVVIQAVNAEGYQSQAETSIDVNEETIVATVTYELEGTIYTDSYATLEEALENTYVNDTVKLVAQNYTMTSSATLPAGVTLIIPTASDANDTITGNNVSGAVTSGTAYATLTVPENVSLTVNGTLLVAGNQQGSVPQTGCLTGNYGKMVVDGDVVLNSGGKLYARGEVSGSGTITAKSGSNVYQLFQINDWRGGTATSSIYSSVFPFNLYDVNNITAKTVYEYGSHMYGRYYVVYTFLGSRIETNEAAMVLGAANDTGSLFRMTSSDASVVVENATDVTLYGNVSTGPLTIIFNTIFGRVNLTTENMTCPIYNMNVVVENGGSLTITDSLKFLPGASLSVSSGGELAVASGKSAYFYAVDDYSSDYYWQNRASVGDTDAALNATLGSSVSGVIASSDDTMSNITIAGISPTATGTDIVKEATQSNTSTTIVDVTFYTVSRAVSGPALAISYPADGAVVSAASMTVTGTVSDNVSTVAGVTVNGQPALVADGAFSASISLSPGVNTITAEAVNAVGLSTVQSITVTLDTVPPVITLTAPAQGAILSDNNVTVTGTASDDGSGIASLTVNGQEVPVGEGGAFSAIVQIPDGAGSITAVAVDRAGLSSQQTVRVIVDTTPPALTVDSPAEGEITSQASLLVSGTASDPISGVQQVLVNGQPAALSEGAFSIEVSLSEGLNTITVSALNAAGLSASVTRSVMLDSVPPLLTVSSPTAGEMTGIADFVLSGTVSDATSGVASVTINGLPALVQDGAFSQPVILDEGQNTFVFTATDNAGLQTTVTRTVLLDTAAPALAVTSPVDDLITNIPALTIAGTVSDSGSGLEGVTVNGDAVQVMDGAFSLDVLLTEGDNTFSVVAADLLGHTSTVTRSVLLDTTAPVIEAVALTPDFSANPIGSRFVLVVLLAPSPAPKAAETVTGTVNGMAVSFSESPALMWTALVPRGDGFAVKLTASDAAGNVTTASLFFPDGLESKFDWTALDYLNSWDLNRVERNTDFILRILRQCGYNPKNYGIDRDWTMPDIPTRSQIDRVRRNVDALQEGFLLLPEWRQIVYNSTVDAGQMNAIEWDLQLLDQWLVRLQKGVFIYSGDVFAGEV